jgi:hypothetical protein
MLAPNAALYVRNDRGNIEGYYGQDRDARLHIMGAVNLATQEGNADSAARSLGFLALLEAELGHTSRAQQILGRLSSMHRQRYASVPVALGFPRTGNLAEAQQLANNITRDFPQDTMLQQYGFLSSVRRSHCNKIMLLARLKSCATRFSTTLPVPRDLEICILLTFTG